MVRTLRGIINILSFASLLKPALVLREGTTTKLSYIQPIV